MILLMMMMEKQKKSKSMKKFIDIAFEKENYKKDIDFKKTGLWIERVLSELKLKNHSLSLFFTSVSYIRKLNKNYLKKDFPTDVLSFSQFTGKKIDFINSNLLGDIVICIPYIKKKIKELNHSLEIEINYLILHGILHLIGYDHENKKDHKEMFDLQNKIFKKLGGVKIE